ncbi:MAG TPA: hypothetical protein VFK50_09955 [Sphingomicrobium sp.]|nr:hypothetical protein [Sphingomicrobium sp.]
MSRHWNPEDALAGARAAPPRRRWPEGATAGVALVAVACVGMAFLLYRLAGPRDVIGG